jgi:dTDP-4-amino-4,6-dideoxygalactose transaminase
VKRPAILSGGPAFEPPLPFARPTIEEPEKVLAKMSDSLESGMVTNGPVVRELEKRVAAAFEVDHCVAVSSCTTGLMLVAQALRPAGDAAVPSFTFAASAHALAWNGLTLTFVDCDPLSWCLRPEDIPEDARLVMGVHVSGVPCDVDGLQRRCAEIGAELMYDAAHGSGSLARVDGKPRPLGGFGRAEVFSLTPTKVMSGAEGGLVTTTDTALAERLRLARDYGNPGDYDTRYVGLNGRLSELNAALALQSLDHLEERVKHRNVLAERYREILAAVPGVGFQQVRDGDRSSYKDFTILIDESEFRASREAVVAALQAEGIPTRPYYSPPLHRQQAYAHLPIADLPVTDRLASQVISLPIWSHMNLDTCERISDALVRIQRHARELPRQMRTANSAVAASQVHRPSPPTRSR